MLRTQSTNFGNIGTETFTDHTVEEACSRMRDLAHRAIKQSEETGQRWELTLFIGPVHGGPTSSYPRKESQAATLLGLDPISLMGVVERSIRLLHHPAIADIKFNADGHGIVTVRDVNGKTFRITAIEVDPQEATHE